MAQARAWSVGEVAALAGVSVRTLRHYDEVGLCRPSSRTRAGHRRYTASDVERLRHVLAYRELGFGLDEVAVLVADGQDPTEHLRRQHQLLLDRIERLRRVSVVVQRAMEAAKMGIRLDPQEMLEVFGEHDPTQHAAEAEERWGETDSYQESARRTSSYTKQDWLQMKEESAAVDRRYVAALTAGAAADSAEAMAAAEAHRQHISRWFYDCSYEMHRGLGELYLADPRFTQRYDELATGLAAYVKDAIAANADRHATD